MPRPKRTKVQSTKPTAARDVVAKPLRTTTIASESRPLEKRTIGDNAPERDVSIPASEDDIIRVASAQHHKSHGSAAQEDQESFEGRSSRLRAGVGSERNTAPTADQHPQTHQERAEHNEATNQEEDIEGRFTSVSRSSGRITGHVRATKPPSPRKMTGFEEHMLSSSPRAPQPPSGSRAQATPSFLSMSGFKRRPRQPSLLQMVQQQNDAVHSPRANAEGSDVEDSVLRELEASSPQVQGRATRLSSSGFRKRKAIEIDEDQENAYPSSPPRLRERSSSPVAPSPDAVGAQVQVPATQSDIPIYEDQDAIEEAAQIQAHKADIQADAPSPQHDTQPSPQLPRPRTDRIRSSSSPPRLRSPQQSTAAQPSRQTGRPPLKKRTTRMIKPKHAPLTQRSPSPPLSAPSPVSSSPPAPSQPSLRSPTQTLRPTVKVTHRRSDGLPKNPSQAPAKAPIITTEALRRLMPRSRKPMVERQHDSFDIGTSSPTSGAGDDNDDDAAPSRPRGASRRQPMKNKSVNVRVGGGKTKGKTPARVKAKAKAAKPTPAAKRRTYGAHGKENAVTGPGDASDEDGDEGIEEEGDTTIEEASKSRELRDAARKFAQVDDWEMSFESCDVLGGSSSPWR